MFQQKSLLSQATTWTCSCNRSSRQRQVVLTHLWQQLLLEWKRTTWGRSRVCSSQSTVQLLGLLKQRLQVT
jgi:hypothetical protein